MKKLSILAAIALMAIIYSCGNSGSSSKEQNTDSVATAQKADNEQAQKEEQPSMTAQEKAELYKYFSQEEIKKGMDNAKSILCVVDKEIGGVNVVAYDNLFEKEGFAMSPDKLEKKWGKAKQKKVKTHRLDYGEGEVHNKTSATMEFSNFDVVLVECGKDCWGIESLQTATKGFGFGGVYVGVPECDKAYLLQLFKNFEVSESKNEENTILDVTLHSEFYRGLRIVLDKNQLVKSVQYEVSTSGGL